MSDYNNKQYENNDVLMMRMYEKTSKAGNTYFSCVLGPCRYSLVKTKQTNDQGEPVWVLKISAMNKDSISTQRPVSRPVQRARDEDEDFLSEFVG